jgi:glycogen(starch) synthase
MPETLAPETLAVVSPWYPGPERPFMGAFVKAMVEAAQPRFADVDIFHTEEWTITVPDDAYGRLARQYESIVRRRARRIAPMREPEGRLHRVPVPVIPRRPYRDLSLSHERFLRAALGGRKLPSPIVHAHVGLPGGWAALANASPGARVFVTEHATYLDVILRQPEARGLYDEVIDRATGFFCVSELLRRQLVTEFPHHADKVRVVPNAIPFERIPARAEPVTDLRRWLYVGSLIDRKGVRWLLEAFAICHKERDDLELTMVGSGPLLPALIDRVAELGLQGAVRLVDPVPPAEIFGCFADHDLLVHPSRYETFGMTMVEAIACGTPVLVTRCGGPEETLAGIEGDAGVLIDVTDRPDEIVSGYHDLAARLPDMDLPRARGVLESRYGYRAVADVLSSSYFADGVLARSVAGR